MGEWKAQISLRVRQDLRRDLEEFADKERRKLGNVGETLLEWAWEQLQVAGSIDRLLKFKIRSKAKRIDGGNPTIGTRTECPLVILDRTGHKSSKNAR
jgi:hypothetical protein